MLSRFCGSTTSSVEIRSLASAEIEDHSASWNSYLWAKSARHHKSNLGEILCQP